MGLQNQRWLSFTSRTAGLFDNDIVQKISRIPQIAIFSKLFNIICDPFLVERRPRDFTDLVKIVKI